MTVEGQHQPLPTSAKTPTTRVTMTLTSTTSLAIRSTATTNPRTTVANLAWNPAPTFSLTQIPRTILVTATIVVMTTGPATLESPSNATFPTATAALVAPTTSR